MHLPVSVTQDELLEVLLQVAPVRPVFIWGAPGIGKSALVEKFAEAVDLPIARKEPYVLCLEELNACTQEVQ